MSQQTNPKLRSDVSRRAPIDSGLIRRPTASENVKEKSSEEYLAQITEEWHKRIDVEIKSLAQGMSALCQTALLKMPDPSRKDENRLKSEEDKIKTPKDKYHAQQDAFQARAIAENMAVAADSLMSITHSLKLMYLLCDEEEITTRKAEDLRLVRNETRLAKEAAASHWDQLFDKGNPAQSDTDLEVD